MTTYNNENIKTLLNLFKKGSGKRTKSNLVTRLGKLGIEANEVLEIIELLLDLNVIQVKEEDCGDGWNSRVTAKYYSIV